MERTIGERIKELRKALGLRQKNFGEKIGVTESTMSGWEIGRRTPTTAILISICREFKVNYLWLTEGSGDMFSNIPNTLIDKLADEYELDEVDKLLIKKYICLSEENRKVIKDYLLSVFVDKKSD